MTNRNAILRSVLAGAATGARTTAAVTPLALMRRDALPGTIQDSLPRVAGAGMAFEFLMDKMPFAHSRLGVVGLGARLAAAGFVGATLAQADGDIEPVAGAAIACAAAIVGARLGHDMRVALGRHGHKLGPAVIEDVLAVTAGIIAVSGF